jgi:hypothetical protein
MFDVLASSETWLNPNISNSDVSITCFNTPKRKDMIHDRHSRVILYIKDSLFYKRRLDLEQRNMQCKNTLDTFFREFFLNMALDSFMQTSFYMSTISPLTAKKWTYSFHLNISLGFKSFSCIWLSSCHFFWCCITSPRPEHTLPLSYFCYIFILDQNLAFTNFFMVIIMMHAINTPLNTTLCKQTGENIVPII